MSGTLILALAFLRGARVSDQPAVWGEPLMPQRREAWDQMLRTELEGRAHRRDVAVVEFRDRR
jgi:hypothetical protein